jgi:hypothetical protein
MMRKNSMVCVVSAVLVTFVMVWQTLPIRSAVLDFPGRQAGDISVRIDKQEVVPGELVRMEETIAAKKNARVIGVKHDVLRIGRFDPSTNGLVNLDKDEFRLVSNDQNFDNLPWNLGMSHGMSFDVQNPRRKGTEFEFRPKRLGIYLITVSWLLRENDASISSYPAVLIVKPPVDGDGKPIVKAEWLEEKQGKD